MKTCVPCNDAIDDKLFQVDGNGSTPGGFEIKKNLTTANFVVIGCRNENKGPITIQ